MLFQHVIGQNATKTALRKMAGGERLPHALLLLGPPGSGSLPLALALAQFVLCEQRSSEDACGKCPACLKTSRLIHPDVHFSFPAIGPNATSEAFLTQWRSALEQNPWLDVNDWLQSIGAENKQGNITKEECVNIIRKFSLKTFEARHKILIQWLPEYLGKEGNRLLKLIEEPPENTIFILVAEDTEQILNTILSRCQLVKVPALEDADVVAGLIEKTGAKAEEAAGIAYLANGNFNEALRLSAHKDNDHSALFLDWMRRCYKGDGREMLDWVERFAKLGREGQKFFVQYALHFLREFIALKINGPDAVRLQPNELETGKRLASVLSFEQVAQIVHLLTENAYFIERNANPKILFLDACIQANRVMKTTP
ncbi:MAG: hypothetical protein HUU01_00015 [Saprospiraceae bacterium]|nr:hypothetical protein [Saprospiraceae bacterium]